MVKIHAHRGASSLAPENTVESALKAVDHHADYVEVDIRQCKSGEIIAMHDPKIDRTTNGKGLVAEMTLAELRKKHIRKKYLIPTLEEIIKAVDGRCRLNIEIKSMKQDDRLLEELIRIIKKHKIQDSVLVSSFNHIMLKKLKDRLPSVETAALFIDKKSPSVIFRRMYYIGSFIRKTKRIHADAMNLPYQFITRRLLRNAFDEGLKVNAWTVNSDKAISKMKLLGVDGIITNYPQKFEKH
ncbi:MAG: glycerophosphodiester phosphodiesterase [Nanoarchaeota archaeon]